MPLQLALDEWLFRRMEREKGEPVFRFYFSSEPWVSVGYASKNYPEPDSFPVCRRITGGGSVTHGADLMFALIATKDADESFRSVRLSYLKIHEAVRRAFESLGKRPEFYRCDENLPKGPDCFRFPVATDLRIDGQKIAGGAERRSSGAFLHEESIPWKRDPLMLTAALQRAFAEHFQIEWAAADIEPEWIVRAETLAGEKYAPLALETIL